MLLPDGQGRELSTQLSAAEFEDVARAFLARGRLPAWREQLNRWLVLLNQEVTQQVEATTQLSTIGVHALLRRLRVAPPEERGGLSQQLQAAVQEGILEAQESSKEASRVIQQPRSIINAALALATAVEVSGINAKSLGRGLRNRSGCASQIDRSELDSLRLVGYQWGAP